MKPILLVASTLVTFALIAYSIGIISEIRIKRVVNSVVIYLGVGLLLDISGTTCMIIGSTNSPFTYHGFMGYSALLAMFMDNVLLWNLKIKQGTGTVVIPSIHKYSVTAYAWWVFVYLSGILMAINR